MPGKPKKSTLDVGYLKTATSNNLASSIFMASVQEEEQRLLHEKEPQQIAIDALSDNPYQPRVTMDEQSLQQLSETIASHGFQGILVARPHPERTGMYQITAGHRRREAAKRAGLKSLPVIVHSWSDQDMATLAATENIQREDLSPLEEGKLFQLMIDEMGLTQVEVANAVKKDRGYVRNRLRLAKAPEDIQAFVATKTDSMRAVIYLLDIENPAERAPLIQQLLQKTLTTEDLPAYLEEIKRHGTDASAPSHIASAQPPASDDNSQVDAGGTTPAHQATTTVGEAIQATSSQASAGQESNALRIRYTKLKTVLRYVTEYQRSLPAQPLLTEKERSILQQIVDITQALAST